MERSSDDQGSGQSTEDDIIPDDALMATNRTRRASEPSLSTCSGESESLGPAVVSAAVERGHSVSRVGVPDRAASVGPADGVTAALCRRLARVRVGQRRRRRNQRPALPTALVRPPRFRHAAGRRLVVRPARLLLAPPQRTNSQLQSDERISGGSVVEPFPGAGSRVFTTAAAACPVAPPSQQCPVLPPACSVQHRRPRPVSVDELCSRITQASIMSSMAEMMYT